MNEETAMRELYGPIREILEREGLEPALEALWKLPKSQNEAVRDLIADFLELTLRYTKNDRPANVLWSARAYARGCVTRDDLRDSWFYCTEADDTWGHESRIEREIAFATMFAVVDETRVWVADAARAAVDILVQAGKTKSEAWGELELIFTQWLGYNMSAPWLKGDSQ